jgi:hypothetical protein
MWETPSLYNKGRIRVAARPRQHSVREGGEGGRGLASTPREREGRVVAGPQKHLAREGVGGGGGGAPPPPKKTGLYPPPMALQGKLKNGIPGGN